MTTWGWWLIIIGIVVGLFGLFFDMVAYADVNNIGLIADRIVVVMFGGIVFLAGVILLAGGALQFTIRNPASGSPPAEEGAIKPGFTVNARD